MPGAMAPGAVGSLVANPAVKPPDAPFDWTVAISIRGSAAPYQNLAPVAQHVVDDPWISLDGVKLDRPLAEYVKQDGYPLPSTADREGYHGDRHYDYWLSGLKDYLLVKQAANRAGLSFDAPCALFDFGCASGRVLRHFLCNEPQMELWAADINARHTEWVRRFLGPRPKALQNHVLPHLPFEDNSLSLVYAFSVFTHIDEFELAWLTELRRVLKKGGLAYLTVHTEHTWQTMGPTRALYHDLMSMRKYIDRYDVTPELFTRPMPEETVVFRWRTAWNNNSSIFHSTAYLKNTWGRFFDLVDLVHEGHDYQDVVVLRKA